MSRRTNKKLLRRAEEALLEHRFADAQVIYSDLLESFTVELPSLLDHAAALFGLIQALNGLGLEQDALDLAEEAVEILAVHETMTEVAA